MQGRSQRVVTATVMTLMAITLFGGMALPPPAPSVPPAGTPHALGAGFPSRLEIPRG